MMIKDTTSKFGFLTKFFHWTIAALVLAEICLVYYTQWMLPPHSPTGAFLINNLHKPLGITLLGLTLLFFVWRLINPHPALPIQMHNREKLLARLVQSLLFLSLLLMPISGLIMSTAAGYPPNYFGLYQVPLFIPKNPDIAQLFFSIHETTANITIFLVSLHFLAALKHHFINRDDVLKRMLR